MDAELSYVDKAEQYVDDVLAGRKLVCKWIRMACERHRRDLARIGTPGWDYYFDYDKANKVTKFMTRFPHVKGRWAAAKKKEERFFDPQPWQCFWYCSLFGWLNVHTSKRRFRKARLYVPRKNGKSLMTAPIGLYMLAADDEPGSEVFSGATNEKQAWEVFGPAKQMATLRPDFLQKFGIQVNAKSLTVVGSLAKFEPVIGKPGDGSNPQCSITDEYHEHENDDQLATMETGMGAREQPLSIVVSTAGDNIAGPCREDWLECEKMLLRTNEDETLFALIYTIDNVDDWAKPESLEMANPNYGVSIEPIPLLQNQKLAVTNARKQGHFKIKHLNIWIQAREAYFNVERWRESAMPEISLADFKGRRCYVGLDLASKKDLCALVLLFPLANGEFFVFAKHYLPRDTVDIPENDKYQAWEREGLLTVTEGNQTDYKFIFEDIVEIASLFDLAPIAYDPHNATMLTSALMDEGIDVVEYGATVLNFSEPMKECDALIEGHKIHHDGDKIMEWALSNVVNKRDRKDNDFPNKEKFENKIDAAVALIMAMGRFMVEGGAGDDFDGFINDPVIA
jgi:phage terminase large subunit-like protein